MSNGKLTPIVRWAQNGPQIDITLDLYDVANNADIDISETAFRFEGSGHGAHGDAIYNVEIEFFSKIDHKESNYTITDRNIAVKLVKQVKGEEWPRLLKAERRPAWLKIDFDKWQIEDSDDGGNDGEMKDQIDRITFENRVKSEVDKAKNDLVIYGKTAWLSTYYMYQIISYFIIFGELVAGLYVHGADVTKNAYNSVAGLLLSSHILSAAEVIHPLIGISNVALRAPLAHISIRNFILFALIAPVKQFHQTYVLYLLFLAVSISEIIRYPHNLLTLHRFDFWICAWIRYSAWIVTYPVAFFCGGFIVFKSIFLASEMHRWEYPLPNALNVSFSLSSFLIIFLIVYCPACVYFMKHMWKLRQRKVSTMFKGKEKKL